MKKFIFTGLIVLASAVVAVTSYSSRPGTAPPNMLPPFGSISGFVVDENGKPIAGATVYARLADQGAHGQMNSMLTDREGRFLLGQVRPGLNTVHAFKEEDGYPDTFFAFYVTSAAAIPHVTVFEGQVANVTVQLGPKAIRVALNVSDSDSNEPIKDASLELRRAADPSVYVSMSCRPDGNGKCQVLIPPQPTRVKMKKAGYEDLDITDQITAQVLAANRQPSETREMAIRLRRTKQAVP